MEYIKTFLGGAGGAAIVAGLFALFQWRLNRKAQKEDKAADRKHAENEGMKEILQKMDVLFLADRTILFDRIKHLGKSYIGRGYITVEELEDLKLMHQVYHDPDKLNGNGFLDALMDTVTHSLEIRAK